MTPREKINEVKKTLQVSLIKLISIFGAEIVMYALAECAVEVSIAFGMKKNVFLARIKELYAVVRKAVQGPQQTKEVIECDESQLSSDSVPSPDVLIEEALTETEASLLKTESK